MPNLKWTARERFIKFVDELTKEFYTMTEEERYPKGGENNVVLPDGSIETESIAMIYENNENLETMLLLAELRNELDNGNFREIKWILRENDRGMFPNLQLHVK